MYAIRSYYVVNMNIACPPLPTQARWIWSASIFTLFSAVCTMVSACTTCDSEARVRTEPACVSSCSFTKRTLLPRRDTSRSKAVSTFTLV